MKKKVLLTKIGTNRAFAPPGFPMSIESLESQIDCKLLQESLTDEQIAGLLKFAKKTVINRVSLEENFPPYFILKFSQKRYYPKSWFDIYLQMQ
jgi:hypothetical protein